MDEIIYAKLSSLSEVSKAQLEKILTSVKGSKDLTIETSLIKPLERICRVSWLKTQGVEKIYKLNSTASNHSNIQFFMIYTNSNTFQEVLQQILAKVDIQSPCVNKYHIICVPKSLYFYEELIETNALWNCVQLYSFQWFPIHLDEGILSLELPQLFRSLCIQEDLTFLPVVTKSIWHMFLSLGRPSFSLSLGCNSSKIMKQLDEKLTKTKTTLPESEIGGFIIIDRSVDYPSMLLTPGTYSALLHEVYNVKCGYCKEEQEEITKNDNQELDEQFNRVLSKQPVSFPLDSKKDNVYKMIKDKNFVQVTEILRDLTKDLKVQGETSDMALHEMKKYVQTKLQAVVQKKQMIANHLNAAETVQLFIEHRLQKLSSVEANILQNQSKSKILNQIEEYLQTERDAPGAMAMFLLLCTTQRVSDSDVKSFLHKFFIEFGYNSAHFYQKLVKMSFIESVSTSKLKLQLLSKSAFFTNANKLKQLIAEPEKVNMKNPTCCSYVFGGLYIPTVAQIASLVLSGTPTDDLKVKLQNLSELSVSGSYKISKKSLLIYVVGGITHSEIAALNLLESMIGVKIIKVSDRIVSKESVTSSLLTV